MATYSPSTSGRDRETVRVNRRCRFSVAVLATLAFLNPGSGAADDLYAVRFVARSEPGCLFIRWEDELVFHNAGMGDRIVTLLGVSNGALPETNRQLLIPAGRTVRLDGSWTPRGGALLWVLHLDVPVGVAVQSRAEAHTDWCGGAPPSPTPDMGSFSLPVFRALTAANVRQVHLGADLGSQGSYVNVGIYNAGIVSATSSIELRQACDDSLLDQRTVEVPPNSIIQVSGMSGNTSGCPRIQGSWTRYVTVKVDQPSLSYIVNKKSGLVLPTTVPYNSPH
jgi:hypothetical protein